MAHAPTMDPQKKNGSLDLHNPVSNELFNPFASNEPQDGPPDLAPFEAGETIVLPSTPAKTSAPQKATSSRPKKSVRTKSRKNLGQPPTSDDRTTIHIYVSRAQKKKIQRSCLELDMKEAQLGRSAILDYLDNTFICSEPSCGCEFTLSTLSGSERAPVATLCPCCGSRKIVSADF